MSDKVFLTQDRRGKGEEVKLVDNIADADYVIDDRDIVGNSHQANRTFRVTTNSQRGTKKLYVRGGKGGVLGGFGTILLFGPLVGIVTTFSSMPLGAKLLTVTYVLLIVFSMTEVAWDIKKTDAECTIQGESYISKLRIYRVLLFIIFFVTHYWYGWKCFFLPKGISFSQFSQYYYADFRRPLTIFALCALVETLFMAIIRFGIYFSYKKQKFSDIMKRKAAYLIIILVIFSAFVASACIMRFSDRGCYVSIADNWETQVKKITCSDVTAISETANEIVLYFKIRNDTLYTIQEFRDFSIRFYDTETGETLGESVTETKTFNGGCLKPHAEGGFTVKLFFPNGISEYRKRENGDCEVSYKAIPAACLY